MKVPEIHPLEPFLPSASTLLMLGTFPPARERWAMEFFYPNFQNDMWRIFGLAFFGDKDYFLAAGKKSFDRERLIAFLSDRGIALGDTAAEVIRTRDNASDQYLEIVRPVDLETLLRRIPMCRALVTTGQKATDTLCAITGAEQPRVGGSSEFEFGGRAMTLYRMPSSSRAYPLPLARKAEVYEGMFSELGMLDAFRVGMDTTME